MSKEKNKPTLNIDKKKNELSRIRESLYHSADDIFNMERVLIPWSPAMDEVLGGGIVSGGITNLTGAAKVGKTTSLLHLVANAQKPEYGGRYWGIKTAKKRGDTPGRPVFFYNIENRLTKRDLLGIPGLNLKPDKFRWIGTTEQKKMYLEDYTQNIEETIDLYPGCIIFLDSIGALCSSKMGTATEDGQIRDPSPLLVSGFLKRVADLMMARDIIMLNVLHKVSNTGAKPGQSQTTITGGKKIQYAANNSIEITHIEDIADDNAIILHLKGITSELGPPHVKADAYLKFDTGLYKEYELVNLCTQTDCNNLMGIGKNGAWYVISEEITGGKPLKVQGQSNAASWLIENPNAYQKIYNKYKEACWDKTRLYENNNA